MKAISPVTRLRILQTAETSVKCVKSLWSKTCQPKYNPISGNSPCSFLQRSSFLEETFVITKSNRRAKKTIGLIVFLEIGEKTEL
jgi:hypothetical protein